MIPLTTIRFGEAVTTPTTQTKQPEVAEEIQTKPIPTASRDTVSINKPKMTDAEIAAKKLADQAALQRQLEAKQATSAVLAKL